jgi:hypothetical protein
MQAQRNILRFARWLDGSVTLRAASPPRLRFELMCPFVYLTTTVLAHAAFGAGT